MQRLTIAILCVALLGETPARAERTLDPALAPYLPGPVQVDSAAGYVNANGAIRIGGAEHVRYIVERFNALFAQAHPGVRFALEGKGTSSALPAVMFGHTLFGAMGRAINPIERVPYQKVVGADPIEIAIAHTSDNATDGLATTLAVYVNHANPLKSISTTQLSQILAMGNPGGDYSVWDQLGLTGVWTKRAIHPYGTPAYTGFGEYLQQTHLAGRALALTHQDASNSEAILQCVGGDPGGIGVAALGLENARVRQLAIVGPDDNLTRGTDAEVAAGHYPLGRLVYFYVRKLPGQPLDPLVHEYLKLVLSREGQAIIAGQPGGYIPLSAEQAQAELHKLDVID